MRHDAGGSIEALEALHAEVDEAVHRLEVIHAERLHCGRGCSACCVDGLTVFQVEADRIRRAHGALLAEGQPHPVGACAFLDGEGACRIYDDRPYVCRTQGLPLRWIEDDGEGGLAEYRDICELNEEGAPLVQIGEERCWTIGPFEGRLHALQRRRAGEQGPSRVLLRELFGG